MIRHRTRRRSVEGAASERGAAVFIVLMAVTLLTAVGLYAARSATLVDQASGFDRQAMQAHYLAVYGILASSAELSGPRALGHLSQGSADANDDCPSLAGVPLLGGQKPFCRRMYLGEINRTVDSNFSGHQLLTPAANGSPFVPGSLGPYPPSSGASVNGDFVVEITEPNDLPFTAGNQQDSPLKMVEYTLTSTGMVGRSSSATCDASAATAGEERVRAHVIVGPLAR